MSQEAAAAAPLVLPPKGGYNITPVNQYCKIHPLQEVGHLTFTAQKRSRSLSLSLSPYPPQKIIFIQSISYMFNNIFWWYVRTYGIQCLFHLISCSQVYSYFYYVYIVIVSILTHDYILHLTYSLYHQIIFSLKRVLIRSVYFLFEFDQYFEVQIFLKNLLLFIYNRSHWLFIYYLNITFLPSYLFVLVFDLFIKSHLLIIRI